MARLHLIAEGQTEQTFADTVLRPHLAYYSVYLRGATTVVTSRHRGKVYKGGGSSYQLLRNHIARFLKQEKGADVFFTTMIDLYSLYSDIPGREEADRFKNDPVRRVESMEASFALDVGDRRFIPYIQLHEYETYLFADVSQLSFFYDKADDRIARLQAIADAHATPELIDDGPTTAPSKRIIQEFPDYADAKPTVGPQVAELIGLPAIRAKCPHFDAWVAKLEALGGGHASGGGP
ncbi:MAG: DUF4276 family protein [Planctomycetia bacterium]